MLRTFWSCFWLVFIPSSILTVGLWTGRRFSLGEKASSVGPERYAELSGFSKADRERLLLAADRRAFACWRIALPPVYYAAVISIGVAAARSLWEAGVFDRADWACALVFVAIFTLGIWLGRQMEKRRVRRFLGSVLADASTASTDSRARTAGNDSASEAPQN